MPATPADDHTEEFEQLAGLAALGVLEGEDQVRFEAHAADCERCRVMLQLDREALARAAPEMDPSPDFKARLMQRAAAELASQHQDTAPAAAASQPVRIPLRPAQPPPNVIPLWRRAQWPRAIAALLVVGLVVAGAYTYQNQVVASYALSGNLGGSAVVNVRRSGATELDMSGVQNPPPGYIYEAWIIPPNGQPVAAGSTPTGDATLSLGPVSSGSTVAVTQEQGRVDAPTSAPIMAVVVQS
ncbi:MAG: anti-sigma factor [Chloroflexi bacterium]|nr:anti-sigma factor [Chloroflexota bacterium]MBV9595792.1 anti-sigma factor [Chloroflexota bacterium]